MNEMDRLIRAAVGYAPADEGTPAAEAASPEPARDMNSLIRAAAGVTGPPEDLEPPVTSFDGGARESVPAYVDPSVLMDETLRQALAHKRGSGGGGAMWLP